MKKQQQLHNEEYFSNYNNESQNVEIPKAHKHTDEHTYIIITKSTKKRIEARFKEKSIFLSLSVLRYWHITNELWWRRRDLDYDDDNLSNTHTHARIKELIKLKLKN